MASDISIVSQAFILLGREPISSFDDETDLARIAGNLYPTLRDSLIAEHPWRFPMKKERLGRLTAAPLNEWQYAFQLPSDISGNTWALFDSADVDASPFKHWEQFGREIYANVESVWIDYKRIVPEEEWPAYFTQLMIYECAWNFAEPATEDDEKQTKWFRVARGDASDRGKGGYFANAATIDSQGSPPQRFEHFSLIAARFGNRGAGWR